MTTTAAAAHRSSAGGAVAGGGKYLTFMLGREEYGLPVMKVREIIKVMDITHVPQVAAHVLGVINLRGTVMPVLDLSARLGLGATDITGRHVTVVVQRDDDLVGLVVDEVQETIIFAAEDLQLAA